MKTLRAYLKTLSPDQQKAYAERCGTTIGYLKKSLYTKHNFKAQLVRQLDEHSGGKVSRNELLPGVWDE